MTPEPGPEELIAARRQSRALYWFVGLFSFFANLLMLTGPLYMLQVYDRVLGSRSIETLLALTLLLQDPLLAALAWTFVGLRVLHAAVHLTYNAVMHRFLVYALGAIVLLMMWVRLGWLIILR